MRTGSSGWQFVELSPRGRPSSDRSRASDEVAASSRTVSQTQNQQSPPRTSTSRYRFYDIDSISDAVVTVITAST
jgi:hypothetical protein